MTENKQSELDSLNKSIQQHEDDLKKLDLSYEELLRLTATAMCQCETAYAERDELQFELEHYENVLEIFRLSLIKNKEPENTLLDLLVEHGNPLAETLIKSAEYERTRQATKGAKAKSAKYQPLKELAKKLVDAKKYQSRRNASITIKPEIIAEAKKLGIALSEDQAQITIYDWLTEMGLPANI